MAEPNPSEVSPWYLRNITQALELDSVTGQVHVRSSLVGGNVTIAGNVIVSNVAINELGNVDISGNTMPVSGNITVAGNVNANVTGGNVTVSGNVGVSSLPAITGNVNANVTGNVNANITGGNVTVFQGTDPWMIDGNVTAVVSSGNITVTPDAAQLTAFQEPLAIPITPVIQADATYGLDPNVWTKDEINGGNISATNSVWSVSSGTSLNGYSRLKTNRFCRYQPGQGAMARWTAAFTVSSGTGINSLGVNNAPQIAGFLNREDGYAFGFSGKTDDVANKKFGILHRYGGKVEVRTLTITQYNTGAQTATITLNGVAYTVSLTTSTSNAFTCAEIASKLNAQAICPNLWNIDACDSTVTFSYYVSGPTDGTFSFSSSGAGTLAAGTFARTTTGVLATQDWTYISDWNGTIPSNFNPSKLNVFGVDFRWLGAGQVRFFMEDPGTGQLILVHTQKWTSQYNYPHLNKPSLRLSYSAGPTDGTTPAQNAIVSGASVFAGIQGLVSQTTQSQGYSYIETTQKAKDTVWHLMSVQNPYIRGAGINTSQLIIQSLTVAMQGQDPAIIYIIKNATGTSNLLVFNPIPGANTNFNFAQVSNSAVTENLALDEQNNVQTIGINGGVNFDLRSYNFALAPGDWISVFISSGSAINRSSTGMTWYVD